MGLSKESQGRNIQNTALGWHAGIQEHQMANLCVYMIKHITQTVVIYF